MNDSFDDVTRFIASQFIPRANEQINQQVGKLSSTHTHITLQQWSSCIFSPQARCVLKRKIGFVNLPLTRVVQVRDEC